MENHLIKSAVASGGKQLPLSTETQQQQQVENHIHYFSYQGTLDFANISIFLQKKRQ